MMDRLPHEKGFHVSWDQLHRDARALAWRLDGTEWRAVVAVTRGGLVPAMIVARELDIRTIDTISIRSYRGIGAEAGQGQLEVLKRPDDGLMADGDGILVVDDLVDSGRTLANADTIHDFKRGEDLIDVSAMVEGEFTFIKGVALTGTGQAELRIKANPTENWTKVFWDTNGDGKFEGMLYLRNVIGLTADDFIL